MQYLRSLLFLPGNKPDWVEKAWKANPDGIIIDLEDAVPIKEKENARQAVRDVLEHIKAEKYCCIRINSLASGMAFEDLEAIVHRNVHAVMLPKVDHSDELMKIDAYLGVLENKAGIPIGSTSLPLLLETASGMRNAYNIASTVDRVDLIMMSAGPGGDAQRSIGYKWSKTGTETLYLRSKIILDSRAAGVTPLINSWYDINDIEGLVKDARLNRSLGYQGMAVIHPKHVDVINREFTPKLEEVKYYKGLLKAYNEAEEKGNATAVYEGDMVDSAMAETARNFISYARRLGIDG